MSKSVDELAEFLLYFDGFSRAESVCHALVDRSFGVVLGELEDNPGTSLTNALENACAVVATRFFDRRTGFQVFEWLPTDPVTREPGMFRIKWHADGFRLPEWERAVELPAAVSQAKDRILKYSPYDSRQIAASPAVTSLKVENAHEMLDALRSGLAPITPSQDRAPRRRR
jgi:hypothetical protein